VIGSSFIGLEVAASLRHRGLEVTVVGHDVPLAKVLGRELGRWIQDSTSKTAFVSDQAQRRGSFERIGWSSATDNRLRPSWWFWGRVSPRTALPKAAA